MTHFALVPSPLLGSAVWGPVAAALRRAGHPTTAVALDRPVRTPLDVVDAVLGALPDEPVVLVPHSNAGLSAPLVADRGRVAATVSVDAALQPAGAREVTAAREPLLDLITGKADADGLDRLVGRGPRAAVPRPRDQARRRGFGDTYADETAFACDGGWPVSVLPGGHLEQLCSSTRVADEVLRRLAAQVTRTA